MANIVPVLNTLLVEHKSPPIDESHKLSAQLDEFLKEAYRINSHIASLHTYLRTIRSSYLSTSAPPRRTALSRNSSFNPSRPQQQNSERKYLTDTERNSIDDESKSILRGLSGSIQNLSQAEQIRQDTERSLARKKRNPYGALGKWASGGLPGEAEARSVEEVEDEARTEGMKVHRGSVLGYLGDKLQQCNEILVEMIETRIQRNLEKNKSVLYKMKGSAAAVAGNGHFDEDGMGYLTSGMNDVRLNGSADRSAGGAHAAARASKAAHMDDDERRTIESQLTAEQLQLFEQENQDMLKYYENTLDQVRQAEGSLIEISELQTTLASNLTTQSAQIDQLVHDSFQTEENVGGGNQQLKKAAERRRPAKYLFYGSVGFSVLVILYDLII